MSALNFDANTVEPTTEFDAIPAGQYEVVVIESDSKPTRNGNGGYLELKLQIIDGEQKNRRFFDRLVLEHTSQIAVKLARAKLSALCRAAGVLTPRDSRELHDIPVIATVICKRNKDSGEIQNEVRTYSKKEAVQGKPVQAVTDTPPWRRG